VGGRRPPALTRACNTGLCGTCSWFISSSDIEQAGPVEQSTKIDVEASVEQVSEVLRAVER
jgi:ferredoxin